MDGIDCIILLTGDLWQYLLTELFGHRDGCDLRYNFLISSGSYKQVCIEFKDF